MAEVTGVWTFLEAVDGNHEKEGQLRVTWVTSAAATDRLGARSKGKIGLDSSQAGAYGTRITR